MTRSVLLRWMLFLGLTGWGLAYIAWFAHLVADSRDFVVAKRVDAVCAAAERSSPGAATIEFNAGQLDRNMLLAGWGGPEDWGVWTTAHRARLGLPTPPVIDGDMLLTLDLLAPINHRIPEMQLRLRVPGGQPVDWRIGMQRQDARHYLLVPAELLRDQHCIELHIEIANAYRPIQNRLGRDTRLLGIGLRRAGWLSPRQIGPVQNIAERQP